MSTTVITRAASARLTTLENVCLDLGRKMGTSKDRQIERFIDSASADAARVCERTFGRQIYRETVLAVPEDGLRLSAGPVNRIISVAIRGGALFDADDFLIEDGKLLLTDGRAGGIGDGTAYNLWRSLRPHLVVIYEAGWLLPGEKVGEDFTGDTPLPADIQKAVGQLVGVALSEAGRDATVKSDTVEGVGSRSFYVQGGSARLPHPAAEATLEHYRIVSLL